MKTCTKCGETKPLEEFARKGEGWRADCKACKAARKRAWLARALLDDEYKAEYEERQRRHKRRYQERHPERCREAHNRYAAANREKINTGQRERRRKLMADPEYRARHSERRRAQRLERVQDSERREQLRERQREAYANEPSKRLGYNAKRKARKLGVEHEPYSWSEIVERDESTCYLCGDFTDAPTLDHVIPVSRGGADAEWNLRVACGPCNSRKKDRLLSECDWIDEERLSSILSDLEEAGA